MARNVDMDIEIMRLKEGPNRHEANAASFAGAPDPGSKHRGAEEIDGALCMSAFELGESGGGAPRAVVARYCIPVSEAAPRYSFNLNCKQTHRCQSNRRASVRWSFASWSFAGWCL